jgi:hypothetical protein
MRPRIFLVAAVATLAIGLIGVPAAGAASSPTVPPLYTINLDRAVTVELRRLQ